MENEHSVSRVPSNKKLPFFSIALVHMGMLTALDQFMLGAVLGNSMSLEDAFIAILIASLIFFLLTFGLGYAGMKEGLSCSLLARWCGFGRIGSALVGLVIAISLLGWFGVQNAIFGKALNFALNDKLGFALSAAISGSVLTLLVAFGFKALRFTAKLAVPLFLLAVGYISVMTLSGHNIFEILNLVPSGTTITISAAITIIVGGFIVASLITPDITRFCQNGKEVFWITMITVIAGEFVINGLAMILARVLNTQDVVTIMSQAAGGVGLIIVIFSTLRINDINLYSSSLGIANTIESIAGVKLNYAAITLTIGFIGTFLSVWGILDRFIDFLTLLGVLYPPIIGVMLMDYFILKTHRAELSASRIQGMLPDKADTPLIGFSAIIACAFGGAFGFIVEQGIPALNSLLASSLVYWMLKALYRKAYIKRFQSGPGRLV